MSTICCVYFFERFIVDLEHVNLIRLSHLLKMNKIKNQLPNLLPSRIKEIQKQKESSFTLNGLCLSAFFNPANGYGELGRQLALNMSKFVDLKIHTNSMYHKQVFEMGLINNLAPPNPTPKSLLSLQPTFSNMVLPFGYRNAIFTMFESSRLRQEWIRTINEYHLLITPSHANRADFLEQVKCPVEVANQGCDLSMFTLHEYPQSDVFVFGSAAHVGHGRTRKGVERIIDWFTKAFPKDKNVRLSLKLNAWPENGIIPNDSRISVIEQDLSDEDCRDWLRSLNCYIDGSTFEGWGMWNHNAMATGRPVIGTNYSARCEYFKFGNHIPIGYKAQPAKDQYEGLGHWAMPDESDAIEAMRWAFNNPTQCEQIGINAYDSIKHLTWEKFTKRVLYLLGKHGIFNPT